MLTVKEFQDLGVEFVNGDRLGGDYVGAWSAADDFHFKVDPNSYYDFALESFAWRPLNTLPDNPKFKFEQDFTKAEIKWRPLLDQPQTETKEESEAFDKMKAHEFDAHVSSEKPVFTQAMAEPKIGFTFKFKHHIDGKFGFLHQEKYGWEDGDELELIHKVADHNGTETYIVLNTQPDVLSLVKITDISFFDTRTPKQKAVDEMLQIIDDQCSRRKACEIIYNMLVDEKC